MSDEIKKNEQNNGSKKKKIIIIAVAAIVVIAAAVAAFLLLTGDDNGYVDTPVETQDAAPEAPGVEFGVFIEAGSDSPNAPQQGSAGSANDSAQGSAGGSNASQGGGSANDSSGGTGGSNGSQGGGSAQQPEEETQPAARRISINIELPNDGSADDLLFIKVNGEEQTVDGKGVACKINGQTFSFTLVLSVGNNTCPITRFLLLVKFPIVSKLRTDKIRKNRHKYRMLSAFRHRLVWQK